MFGVIRRAVAGSALNAHNLAGEGWLRRRAKKSYEIPSAEKAVKEVSDSNHRVILPIEKPLTCYFLDLSLQRGLYSF